jgi:hypothetical protein
MVLLGACRSGHWVETLVEPGPYAVGEPVEVSGRSAATCVDFKAHKESDVNESRQRVVEPDRAIVAALSFEITWTFANIVRSTKIVVGS